MLNFEDLRKAKRTPAKILEHLAGEALVSRSFFSEREHRARQKRHPEIYQPGYFYQHLTTAEDRKTLQNLKAEDLQSPPRWILALGE